MNTTLTNTFGMIAISIGLICGCTEKADHTAAEGPISSSSDVRTTNETVRVNQPKAYERDTPLSASGTNVQLTDASGAARSGPEGALVQRVQTTLQGDTSLIPVAQAIQITAHEGKVTLAGTVQTEVQKQRIFELTRDIVGADNVDNRIQVKATPEEAPGQDIQKKTQP